MNGIFSEPSNSSIQVNEQIDIDQNPFQITKQKYDQYCDTQLVYQAEEEYKQGPQHLNLFNIGMFIKFLSSTEKFKKTMLIIINHQDQIQFNCEYINMFNNHIAQSATSFSQWNWTEMDIPASAFAENQQYLQIIVNHTDQKIWLNLYTNIDFDINEQFIKFYKNQKDYFQIPVFNPVESNEALIMGDSRIEQYLHEFDPDSKTKVVISGDYIKNQIYNAHIIHHNDIKLQGPLYEGKQFKIQIFHESKSYSSIMSTLQINILNKIDKFNFDQLNEQDCVLELIEYPEFDISVETKKRFDLVYFTPTNKLQKFLYKQETASQECYEIPETPTIKSVAQQYVFKTQNYDHLEADEKQAALEKEQTAKIKFENKVHHYLQVFARNQLKIGCLCFQNPCISSEIAWINTEFDLKEATKTLQTNTKQHCVLALQGFKEISLNLCQNLKKAEIAEIKLENTVSNKSIMSQFLLCKIENFNDSSLLSECEALSKVKTLYRKNGYEKQIDKNQSSSTLNQFCDMKIKHYQVDDFRVYYEVGIFNNYDIEVPNHQQLEKQFQKIK